MDRWRDSGQAYALGLAVLSFPIFMFCVGLRPTYGAYWIVLGTALSGSLGMHLGGLAAYALTRNSGSVVERAALMSPIVVGAAFFIASLPFILFYIVGMIHAWWFGVTIIGVPILALAVAWSFLYLTAFGAGPDKRPQRTLFYNDRARFGTAIWCCIPGIATIGVALWNFPQLF